MLAPSFKSAADLRLDDEERESLISVLGMLERGELQHTPAWDRNIANGFNMNTVGFQTECGTIGCLIGWARFVSGNQGLFGRIWKGPSGTKAALENLFLMKNDEMCLFMGVAGRSFKSVTTGEAAMALRNYLSTGEPNWAEVLA